MYFINSDKEEVANQAIEFWTSLCEVEIDRNSKKIPHNNIVSRCSSSLLEIIKLGIQKIDPNQEDKDLSDSNDGLDWNTCLASTCCLEHLA